MLPDRDQSFIAKIWAYYAANRRSFIWREDPSPYWVFISEVMLQQTQTTRIAERFPVFVRIFPNFETLANADISSVFAQWQGLGYNRRARFLRDAAAVISNEWGGTLRADLESLRSLPGIGPNTAASILSFAFNLPTVFLETNIRTVFIDHFFPGEEKVDDNLLTPLVTAHLDQNRPRDWYYALMDYGVQLKKEKKNAAGRRASSYVRQSTFKGSRRQVRGAALKLLVASETGIPEKLLVEKLKEMDLNTEHLYPALEALVGEGFVVREENGRYRIAK